MKTDPKLTSGVNKLWIKFFLTAVYSTMSVRDHQRPAFHAALGVDPKQYGYDVFQKTSEISRQVFPLTLDIDSPRWQPNLDRIEAANHQIAQGRKQGGIGGWFKRQAGSAKAAVAFISLLTIPSIPNQVPDNPRLQPAY